MIRAETERKLDSIRPCFFSSNIRPSPQLTPSLLRGVLSLLDGMSAAPWIGPKPFLVAYARLYKSLCWSAGSLLIDEIFGEKAI